MENIEQKCRHIQGKINVDNQLYNGALKLIFPSLTGGS